ncbi:MAG TPA: PhoH family protein [Acidobacteriota bacterium]|nr:PhoH family protein [Acidobacteriota bacterium]HNU01135.1 PhoH family protein [Acidobacteriota bacterium]HPB26770.1 PhoH family protein [Acidobacteriota bacterium]HQO26086.1 PhoH family protein [Acidobacteriota bacterium]
MVQLVLDPKSLEFLFDKQKESLKLLESLFNVDIYIRGHQLQLEGAADDTAVVRGILEDFARLYADGGAPDRDMIRRAFREIAENTALSLKDFFPSSRVIQAGHRKICPKSRNQSAYVEEIYRQDLVFAIGPAGTGKTFLAVAAAVNLLLDKRVARIILTRPAVEAGEKLGFLPGDMQEKVNPYLRPLYDALYHMLDYERVQKLLEREVIEIAPLAFMRGRTLSDSFIILDEAQNTTPEQMKMFLTRIGINSKVVVTGDITQVDLPNGKISGLIQAREILREIEGIRFCYFDERDVVRHSLVQLIISAYARYGGQAAPPPARREEPPDAAAGAAGDGTPR